MREYIQGKHRKYPKVGLWRKENVKNLPTDLLFRRAEWRIKTINKNIERRLELLKLIQAKKQFLKGVISGAN